ncbi:MAG: PTS sugar transporter subunit IIA [Candidatus Omnitrophica bacterium]|nr:PTS system fructose-specific EIIABC component [bacterium]NUN96757.1 PTS sugar transporter subunit IIA [Candidatus Omnitrophota bacterium]
MSIAESLKGGRVVIGVTGSSKAEIIRNLLRRVEEKGIVSDLEGLVQAFLEREAKGSTGIGNGIAIPHVRSDQVQELEYVLGNSAEGVDFESLDGEPVHIIFLMIAPAGSHGVHIKALARVSRILNDEALRLRLRRAEDPDEVVRLIAEREEEFD